MTRPKVAIAFETKNADVVTGALQGLADVVSLHELAPAARAAEAAAAEVLFALNPTADLADAWPAAPRWRLIQLLSAGADHVDFSRLPQVPVACNGGAFAEPMAEHILAMALAAIIAGFSRQAHLSSELRDRTLAMLVARNRMAEYTLAAEFPDTGESDGERRFADNDWIWFAEVSETEDPALRRIDVRIRREDDERDLATLSGFVSETGRR